MTERIAGSVGDDITTWGLTKLSRAAKVEDTVCVVASGASLISDPIRFVGKEGSRGRGFGVLAVKAAVFVSVAEAEASVALIVPVVKDDGG